MATEIGDIVQDALGILGEVTGVGTQLYSEPRMIKDAGRAFNLLFKKHWWPIYTYWTRAELNGTDGTIVAPASFADVLHFDDFAAVHRDGQPRGLPTLLDDMNPYVLSGETPQYWKSMTNGEVGYNEKKIRIFPLTSTGFINVRARHHPLPEGTEWLATTIIALDRDLVVFGTAYMALSGDDLNPQAKADVQGMMDVRYKDIMNSMANQKTALGEYSSIPDRWWTPY